MASIRRTNSPAHRAWNQQNPFSPSTPPQRLPSNLSSSSSSTTSSSSYSSPSFLLLFLRVISRTLFPTSQQRKPGQFHQAPPWKRSLLRFLIFFVVGFVLGCSSPLGRHLLGGSSFHSGGDDSSEIRSPVLPSADVRRRDRVIENLRADGIASVELASKEEVGTGLEELAPRKLLIVVTPTQSDALQTYYLARLGQTLRLVTPPLVWIVVEIGPPLSETAEVLRSTGVMFRHLVCQQNCTGARLRNMALENIERHNMDGIVYFADSENVYTLDLFEHIRETRRFGAWPVSMFSNRDNTWMLEGPVCNGSQVIGWYTINKNKQLPRFHVDMSGFAFNSTILWDLKRWHHIGSEAVRHKDTMENSMESSAFTEQLVEDESQVESVPSGCSKIMNWRLQLDAAALVYPEGWRLFKNLEVVIPLS